MYASIVDDATLCAAACEYHTEPVPLALVRHACDAPGITDAGRNEFVRYIRANQGRVFYSRDDVASLACAWPFTRLVAQRVRSVTDVTQLLDERVDTDVAAAAAALYLRTSRCTSDAETDGHVDAYVAAGRLAALVRYESLRMGVLSETQLVLAYAAARRRASDDERAHLVRYVGGETARYDLVAYARAYDDAALVAALADDDPPHLTVSHKRTHDAVDDDDDCTLVATLVVSDDESPPPPAPKAKRSRYAMPTRKIL